MPLNDNKITKPKPNPKPKLKPHQSAQPTSRSRFFDAWNSSSTGHQRAENNVSGSVSWREIRTAKLGVQFASPSSYSPFSSSSSFTSGDSGGQGDVGGRGEGKKQMSIMDAFGVGKSNGIGRVGKGKEKKKTEEEGLTQLDHGTSHDQPPQHPRSTRHHRQEHQPQPLVLHGYDHHPPDSRQPTPAATRQIFANLTVHINSLTASPLVSNHRLCHLLVAHGAKISTSLARRTVTHVILGRQNKVTTSSPPPSSVSSPTATADGGNSAASDHNPTKTRTITGAGGALSLGKLEKEIGGGGGKKKMYFVSVDWVLDSVRNERRMAETKYQVVRLAGKRVCDLRDMMA